MGHAVYCDWDFPGSPGCICDADVGVAGEPGDRWVLAGDVKRIVREELAGLADELESRENALLAENARLRAENQRLRRRRWWRRTR